MPQYAVLWASTLSFLLLSGIVGCFPKSATNGDSQNKPAGQLATKDRPALQVLIVGEDLGDALQLQWQAFSEQPIQIERISREQATDRPIDSTDVWIYPSQFVGDLIASERIVPLTASALGPSLQDSEDGGTSAVNTQSVVDSWPPRWRAASRFGGANYGLPLGSAQLVLVARNLPIEKLDGLDNAAVPIEDRTVFARKAWDEIIEAANLNGSERQSAEIASAIDQMSLAQKEALVDRFLFIASTTNAKRRGFFDLTQLTPRLSTDEFQLAADVLGKLVRLYPETMLADHAEAWSIADRSPADVKVLAMAAPGFATLAKSGDASGLESTEPLVFSKLVFDPFQGLCASVGKKTRQTSVASQFVAWLSEPEQRETLSRLTDRVERAPHQANPLLQSTSLRNYHNLNNRDIRVGSLVLSTRFSGAAKYRIPLAESLVQMLKSPDQTQQQLESCIRAWNQITESAGVLKQRRSVEQAMGFGS